MAKCERGRKCFAQQSISASVNADSAVMHGERGHSSNARRTWTCTANVDTAAGVPECRAGRVLRFEEARAGWWHKPSPRKRETIHRGLRSARSKLAALTQGYNLPLLRSWTNRRQNANAAGNVLHNKPSAPQRTRTQQRTYRSVETEGCGTSANVGTAERDNSFEPEGIWGWKPNVNNGYHVRLHLASENRLCTRTACSNRVLQRETGICWSPCV